MTNISIATASISDAIAQQSVRVSIALPLSAFNYSWNVLHPIFDDCPEHQMMLDDGEVSEEELRVRCALFHHVASLMPMGTLEFLQWAADTDRANYMDWLVAGHLSKKDGIFGVLNNMHDESIEALTEHLIERREQLKKAA